MRPKELLDAPPLELIPGWLAEERGGDYYRAEDVDVRMAAYEELRLEALRRLEELDA